MSDLELQRITNRYHQNIQEAIRRSRIADWKGQAFQSGISISTILHSYEVLPAINFEGCQFGFEEDFSGLVFNDKTSFKRAQFLSNASFIGATFKGPIDFRQTVFNGWSRFDETKFLGAISIQGATFKFPARFDNSIFSDTLHAEGSIFEDGANFIGVNFLGDSYFTKITSKHSVFFSNANFKGAAIFREGSIDCESKFNNVSFEKNADFSNTIFHGAVEFDRTKFFETSSFNSAFFQNDASFQKVVFDDDTDFSFKGAGNVSGDECGSYRLNFSESEFNGEADFNNRNFCSTTTFDESTFLFPPRFHNSRIHQDTSFAGTRFIASRGESHARSFRTLKLAMEKLRSHRERGMFFALEQESLRNDRNTPLSIRILSSLYKSVSDYGQSFVRPLGWMATIELLYFIFYAGVFENTCGISAVTERVKIFNFQFQLMFNPFKLFSNIKIGEDCDLDNWVWFFTLNSLISVSLIAVFLLAIRRRFQMN